MVVPRWSLGWHIGRPNFHDQYEHDTPIYDLNDYYDKYINLKVPFESIWTGQETMYESMMFTYNDDNVSISNAFGGLPQFIEKVQ